MFVGWWVIVYTLRLLTYPVDSGLDPHPLALPLPALAPLLPLAYPLGRCSLITWPRLAALLCRLLPPPSHASPAFPFPSPLPSPSPSLMALPFPSLPAGTFPLLPTHTLTLPSPSPCLPCLPALPFPTALLLPS